MQTAKNRAIELYKQHAALAATDGTLFRRTVIQTLIAEYGITGASAATHYNNAKKLNPIEGLGRAPAPEGLKKPGTNKEKGPELQDDNECFSVLELVREENRIVVGRCQSFLMQGDASEKFDEKVAAWKHCSWVLIQGLGPLSGEDYSLDEGEKEIKHYGEVR